MKLRQILSIATMVLLSANVFAGRGQLRGEYLDLTVNGQKEITARSGETLTYQWNSSRVRTISTFYFADRGDRCDGGFSEADRMNGNTKPWVSMTPNRSERLSAEVQNCQRGVTYSILAVGESESGQTITSRITIRVL